MNPRLRYFALPALFAILTLACGAALPTDPTAAPTLPQPSALPARTPTPLPTATFTSTLPPTPLTVGLALRDVTYCTPGGLPLKMDILYPFTGYGPWPVVLYIHGGAWIGGSKLDPNGDADMQALRQAGYMIVPVSYRLAPDHPFPAMIQDLKCAVRYLRAHAAEYELDPQRIAARGSSAGGHLVSLLAVADESAGWDVGPYLNQSSRVQAAVDLYGPIELGDPSFTPGIRHAVMALFDSANLTDELLASASPLTYVTPNDPPFLILHGDRDDVVKLSQSQNFYAALAQAGVPAELIVVQGGGHGLKPPGDASTNPTREQVTRLIIAFLDRILKAGQ